MQKTQPTLIRLNLHSVVDLITNSSTVIFTYQHSTEQCRDLVQEMLNVMGESELTADEFFSTENFIPLKASSNTESTERITMVILILKIRTNSYLLAFLRDWIRMQSTKLLSRP